MKSIALILFMLLAGCTTAQQRSNCQIACLEKNETYEEVVRHGCTCKSKIDPEKRVYENIDLD